MSNPSLEVPFIIETYPPLPTLSILTQRAMKEGFVFSGCVQIVEQGKILDSDIHFGDAVFNYRDIVNQSSNEVYFNSKTKRYSFVARRKDPKAEARHITQVFYFCLSGEDAETYGQELSAQIRTVEVENDKVPITFWYLDSEGPSSYGSNIVVPGWDEIRGNYPESLAANLDHLINYNLGTENGSLILLHGLAGAGKTYFIRALLKAWQKQCQLNYIVDVDSLFGTGGAPYLVKMLMPDNEERFKLFILEDTGEMVSKDAKQLIGQGLSRMLNVSDGILGQGCKLIMLMTTNEHLGSLHDAISRPGRCFANIEFTSFSPTEAKTWLVANGIEDVAVTKHLSLAELYEIRNQHLIVNKVHKQIGFNK